MRLQYFRFVSGTVALAEAWAYNTSECIVGSTNRSNTTDREGVEEANSRLLRRLGSNFLGTCLGMRGVGVRVGVEEGKT